MIGAAALFSKLRDYERAYGRDRVFPSQVKLAEEIGVHKRTIIRWLNDLVESGRVAVHRMGTCHNRYELEEEGKMSLGSTEMSLGSKMSPGMSLGNVTLIKSGSELKRNRELRRPPQTEKRTEGRRRVWEFDDCDPAELQRFIDEHERRRQAC
jgi:hypothetical protein